MGDVSSDLASRLGLPVSAVRMYTTALAEGAGQIGDSARFPALLRCLTIHCNNTDIAATIGLTAAVDEVTRQQVSRSAGRLALWLRAHSSASYREQFDYFVASMEYEKDPDHMNYQPPEPPQLVLHVTPAAAKPPSEHTDRRYTGRRSSVAVATVTTQPQPLLSEPREMANRAVDDGKWIVLSEGLGSKPKISVADLSPSASMTRLPPRAHGPVITGGRFGGAVYNTVDRLDAAWEMEQLGAGKADDSDGEGEDRWVQMGSAPVRDALPLDPREDGAHAPHIPASSSSAPRRSLAEPRGGSGK